MRRWGVACMRRHRASIAVLLPLTAPILLMLIAYADLSRRQRQSQHLQEHEEQQRLAQQLAQLADTLPVPAAAGSLPAGEAVSSSSSSKELGSTGCLAAEGPPLDATALARQASCNLPGLAVVSNAWARHLGASGGSSSGHGASNAAAADAQRYYKQLHQAAQHQALLNQQLLGTFGLKAYKGGR